MVAAAQTYATDAAPDFVATTLVPFLRRCRNSSASSSELGALAWGYQAGRGVELSFFDIAQAIREQIADLECAESADWRDMRNLVRALRSVHEAIPDAAARFWFVSERR